MGPFFLRRTRSCVVTSCQFTIALSISRTCLAMMMCGSREAGGGVSGGVVPFCVLGAPAGGVLVFASAEVSLGNTRDGTAIQPMPASKTAARIQGRCDDVLAWIARLIFSPPALSIRAA